MKNIIFVSETFQFLEVKFSVYLNRRVFVMYTRNATLLKHGIHEAPKEEDMRGGGVGGFNQFY